jgi:hypothetical protein
MKLSESIVYSEVSVFDRVADKIKDMLKVSETFETWKGFKRNKNSFV